MEKKSELMILKGNFLLKKYIDLLCCLFLIIMDLRELGAKRTIGCKKNN